MTFARNDLVIPLGAAAPGPLLDFWRWLVPGDLRPWFATALGDLFLRGLDGGVWWLDVGTGELDRVAESEEGFRNLVADSENADLWLGGPLVDQLAASGLTRGPGECYSYVVLPILGGEYAVGNFRVYDVPAHLRVWGPIHEQIRDLPDGATVEFRTTD